MEAISKDVVALLQYLLPGFVAAWIFYGLTSFPMPSQFERVVQALIFTVFVQATVYIAKGSALLIGRRWCLAPWTGNCELVSSMVSAILLGLLFAYFANNDKIHKLLRKLQVTRETSYPSEWFGVFLKNVTYVVLHLDGERRLYGWPIEWPSESDKGHFVLVQASWLTDDEDDDQIELTGVESIMVDVKEVKMVEFMKKTWEVSNE